MAIKPSWGAGLIAESSLQFTAANFIELPNSSMEFYDAHCVEEVEINTTLAIKYLLAWSNYQDPQGHKIGPLEAQKGPSEGNVEPQ